MSAVGAGLPVVLGLHPAQLQNGPCPWRRLRAPLPQRTDTRDPPDLCPLLPHPEAPRPTAWRTLTEPQEAIAVAAEDLVLAEVPREMNSSKGARDQGRPLAWRGWGHTRWSEDFASGLSL